MSASWEQPRGALGGATSQRLSHAGLTAMSEFIIRATGAEGAPLPLSEHLPIRATTLRCLPGADGQGEFWCARLDQPARYRLSEGFDRQRCQAEFLDVDSSGEFLWVTVVVVWANAPHERLHPGMRALDVQVAYVVDQTLGRDSFFDPAKVDAIGAAVVDDASQPTNSAPSSEQHAERIEVAHAEQSAEAARSRTPVLRDVLEFDDELNRMVAALASLTGLHPGPRSARRARETTHGIPECAVYEIEPDGLRYFRFDRGEGWQWIVPKNLDDLLYQVVNDTARDLAWRWSEKAPAARAGGSRRQAIATDLWRILMTALDWDA